MERTTLLPGQGLITRILKTTKAIVHKHPHYILHPQALKSDSDRELLQTIVRIGNSAEKKAKPSRSEAREFKHAIRKLEERGGLTWQATDEWPDA